MYAIKCALVNRVYDHLDDLDDLCVEELGEVIDMIKDISKAIYYCEQVQQMEYPMTTPAKKNYGGELN